MALLRPSQGLLNLSRSLLSIFPEHLRPGCSRQLALTPSWAVQTTVAESCSNGYAMPRDPVTVGVASAGMPTILESIASGCLGGNLDEKALSSLLSLPSPVTALSILNKVTSSQDEVRNVSAFVSTAVRNAQPTPGKQELESALALMEQARHLDEKAIRELQGKSVQAACNALGILLQQQEGSVRNPSAYVCRNLQNDRRGPEDLPAAGAPYQMSMAPPRSAPPPPPVAQPNFAAGGMLPVARPLIEISPGGLEALDELLAKWRPAIDQKAWQSLMALDSHAVDILQELDQKADQIRSPSAYVQRAVGNAKAGHAPGRPRTGMHPPPPAPMGSMIPGAPPPVNLPFQAGGQGFAPVEDSPEVGNLFSDQVQAWSPSAYSRSANGNQGQANLISAPNEAFFGCENVISLLDDDAKRALDALPEELGMVSASLDEKALSALHELPPGSAVHIVRNLRKQEAQVTNASAWVCKAVGNMKRPPPPSAGAPEFAKRARV
ncbi:unnamed protein product [Symbiodinium sp. CCMP2592]|nr:unnamed protein product [Symbiodinium sp. CCMP2592]